MGDFKDSIDCYPDPGNIGWNGYSWAYMYRIPDPDRNRNCFFCSFPIMIRKIEK